MRGRVYIDQNVLGNLNYPNLLNFFTNIATQGVDFVISHLHLSEICRSNDPLLFAPTLDVISPVLIDIDAETRLQEGLDFSVEKVQASKAIADHMALHSDFESHYWGILYPMIFFGWRPKGFFTYRCQRSFFELSWQID